MPAYEAGSFDPPAPVVRVVVRGPSGIVRRDIPLLMDTGADGSILPLDVAEAVGALIRPSNAPVEYYDGSQTALSQAELSVEFLRYRLSGPFLLADSQYGIMGRNILNLLVVTLDGPRQSWSA